MKKRLPPKPNALRKRGSIFYLLPALVIFIIVTLLPLTTTLQYSVTSKTVHELTYDFVGFRNYIAVFQDKILVGAVKNTLILTVCVALIQNVFSLYLAVVMNNKAFKGRNFARVMIYIPVLLSQMVLGYMWKLLLSPYRGPFKMLLKALDVSKVSRFNFMGSPETAFAVIIFTMAWQYIGYNMVIYLSGLQNIPTEIMEASELDGANGLRKFFSVTFPMIMPSVTTNLLLNVVGCLKCFEYVYIMTQGGPDHLTETVATYMYNTSFGQMRVGYGCAISVVMIIAIGAVSIFQTKFMRSKEVDF